MVRKMTLQDKKEYMEMTERFYQSDAVIRPIPEECRERVFYDALRENPYVEAYILESGKETAGYAVLAKSYSTEAGGICVWIEEIYMKEAYRGYGLGKEFFAFLKEHYRGFARRLRLEAEEENRIAMHLYRKEGFEELPYLQMIFDFE